MKLTQPMKTQPMLQKPYKNLGLHSRTPQPAQRDQFATISRPQYNISKQIYTSRSANTNPNTNLNSKICPYQNDLVYSQVNDRINEFYGTGYGVQSYNTNASIDKWSTQKRSSDERQELQPQRQREYTRQKQRGPDYRKQQSQNYYKLKNQVLNEVAQMINEHKVQASNSLREGILKLDQRLRRQSMINLNRQFLPLSFMDDVEKQFEELQTRVKNTEIGISQALQICSQKQKTSSRSPTLTLTPSTTALSLNCQQQPKTKQLQTTLHNLKQLLNTLQQKQKQTQKSVTTLHQQHQNQNQNKNKQIQQQLHTLKNTIKQAQNNIMGQCQGMVRQVRQKLQENIEDMEKSYKGDIKSMEICMHQLKIQKDQILEKVFKRIDRVVENQNDLMGQIHKLKIELETVKREENTVSNKVCILEKDVKGLKSVNGQDVNSPRYNMKKSLSISTGLQPVNTLLPPTGSPQISPKNSIQYALPPVIQVLPHPDQPESPPKPVPQPSQTLKTSGISQPAKSMSLTFSLSSIGEASSPKHTDQIISSIKSLKDIRSTKYILDNENNLMDDNGNYILNQDGTHIKLSEEQLVLLKQSSVVKFRDV